MDQPQQQGMNVKIEDSVLKGNYANSMQISFTGEEYVLDFMSLFPPQGIVTNRVIISPGHLKRIVNVMSETLKKIESQSGAVKNEAIKPEASAAVSSTSDRPFGFDTKK